MNSTKKLVPITISALMLVVYLPISLGISTATAESPSFGKKCSHSQYLSNARAAGGDGNLFQCSGSGILTTKNGENRRYYSWVQIKSQKITSKAKPGEICFKPQQTIKSEFGNLKCLPVRVRPPLLIWVK